MFTITGHKVDLIKDPFQILSGERYEFLLDIEVPEDDELYSENGLYVRVIYSVEGNKTSIVKYEIFERTTQQYLEFDLEEEEEQTVDAYCKEHLPKAVK